MTPQGFRESAEDELDAEYLALAMLAVGGEDKLNAADYAAVEGRATTPEKLGTGMIDARNRMQAFAEEIEQDKAGSAAQIANRAGMYAQAGYPIYEMVRRQSHIRARFPDGRLIYLFERSVLDPLAEHCHDGEFTTGCVECAEASWQPIGSLPDIGTRTCGLRDRCHMVYAMTSPEDQANDDSN